MHAHAPAKHEYPIRTLSIHASRSSRTLRGQIGTLPFVLLGFIKPAPWPDTSDRAIGIHPGPGFGRLTGLCHEASRGRTRVGLPILLGMDPSDESGAEGLSQGSDMSGRSAFDFFLKHLGHPNACRTQVGNAHSCLFRFSTVKGLKHGRRLFHLMRGVLRHQRRSHRNLKPKSPVVLQTKKGPPPIPLVDPRRPPPCSLAMRCWCR